MNFASLTFAGFLPLVFLIYWGLRKREWQNIFLLAASYYFYGCWDPRFLLLIWFLTGASYWAGLAISSTDNPRRRDQVLHLYLAISLGVLAVFKYFNFFIDSGIQFLLALGWEVQPIHLAIILPAAISFFTFESLSYVIEIHQRHLPGTTKFRDYALFIAFFPKLVAGPIERPAVLIPQIQGDRTLDIDGFSRGAFLILLGLFKKIAIADGLAPSVESVYGSTSEVTSTDIALATLAFTFQIYCDFSGYSDIARGVSKMLGIELSLNFRFPYFSDSAGEFWRRWHMSLSSWLRDYLYIALGGNRKGEARTRVNLMATMMLGGMWHGAAWNYVLWGFYQGLLLIGYRSTGQGLRWRLVTDTSLPLARGISKALRWAIFFALMCYGWMLFRATSLAQVQAFTFKLLTGPYPMNSSIKSAPISALLGIVMLGLHDLLAYRSNRATFYRTWPAWGAGLMCAVLMFVTLMGLANSRSAFIYFQF